MIFLCVYFFNETREKYVRGPDMIQIYEQTTRSKIDTISFQVRRISRIYYVDIFIV